METFIGCSGFYYANWKGRFYPERIPGNRWLHYYSTIFNTVEINNTFYRMPEEKNLKSWMNQTPPDFKFTIKANRYFTHQKKLVIDDDFRKQLNNPIDHIFEFRHPSWFTEEIFTLLSEHNIGYCMLSAPGGLPEIARATASTAYLRFHGKQAWYRYNYSEEELKTWHNRIENLK